MSGDSRAGDVMVISGEKIVNDSLDALCIDDQHRTILRDPSRDQLTPHHSKEKQKKPKNRGKER